MHDMSLRSKDQTTCLLLSSQIALMKDIFDVIDKDHLQIVRRTDLIQELRTDVRVCDFLDKEAVKVPYSRRTLTLDEVFNEIERDESYEQLGKGKHQPMTNHKEFFTWKEFANYFYDYKEIDDRNPKGSTMEQLEKKR